MDRILVSRILGKKGSVDLDDAIYNLRDISDELSNIIILSLETDEEFVIRNKRRLKSIHKNITPLVEVLNDEGSIQGFANSKKYLKKYIENINININGILNSIESMDRKSLTHYSNMLMDLLLVY